MTAPVRSEDLSSFWRRAGGVGAYGMIVFMALAYAAWRLGTGRLEGHFYKLTLLGLWFLLAGLVCFFVAMDARSRQAGTRSRWAWGTGPSVALLIFLGLYGVAQLICWGLNVAHARHFIRDGTHSTGESYTFDRVLGYAPKPNITAGARLRVDGKLIFDYTYQTDDLQRRIIPSQRNDGVLREKALLLFGGSYVFGEGVNDEDTLPNQLALRMPDVRIYNYAFSGYGPNQMLARLESCELRKEVPERQVAAIYVFIPNHVRRVIGSYSVISWSRHSPYYQLDPKGRLSRLGSFQGERARLTWWYDFFHGDQVFQYFQVDFPLRLRERHFKLTNAIVLMAAARFKAQFDTEDFWVLIYPEHPSDEFNGREMVSRFERNGLRVLDYSALFDSNETGYYFLPHDPHPTAKAHRKLAEKLVRDLHFSDPGHS